MITIPISVPESTIVKSHILPSSNEQQRSRRLKACGIPCWKDLSGTITTAPTSSMAVYSPIPAMKRSSFYTWSATSSQSTPYLMQTRCPIYFRLLQPPHSIFRFLLPVSLFPCSFKNVFDLLPLRVIEMMRTFYLVKPYFYIKAFDMLGQSNRIFAASYCPIDSCM